MATDIWRPVLERELRVRLVVQGSQARVDISMRARVRPLGQEPTRAERARERVENR
jgi:hypothetical protein